MSNSTAVGRVPFVDLAAQHETIRDALAEATAEVFRRSDYILGRDVSLFEDEFARFCEAQYAIGVDSGMSALELSLRAFGIGPGDEVITAANTFIASVFAISATGATPVLVDADPDTYNIDVRALESVVTEHTRAIVPVHLYGHPVDMDAVLRIARAHGLVVLEDACQAHGARYRGRRVGSLADAAAFSFYPGKNLGAYGDGGIVVTNDETIADAVRLARNYGQREKYHHVAQGFNRRLDTLQAAFLRVKLRSLDAWNEGRRGKAALYHSLLAGGEVVAPAVADYAEPVWHLYVVRTRDRDALRSHLAGVGIETGIHYPVPVHLQPAYDQLGYPAGSFPVTEAQASELLSLPMYAELPDEAIALVVEEIGGFLDRNKPIEEAA
jgi:dTDP-4-amino-4,6-dideoxygalactose transaminase